MDAYLDILKQRRKNMNHSAHPNRNNSRKDTKNSNRAIAIVIGVLLIIAILFADFRGCEN